MTNIDDDELEIKEKEAELENTSPLAAKSADELISMNEEAQKQISRQGNEIGELRALVEDSLRKQLTHTEPKKEETELDWDYNTKEAAEQLIDSKVNAIEEKLEEEQRQRAFQEFEGKHPKYKEVTQTDEFREWVQQSSYRTRMYNDGNAGNFSAADELLQEYSRIKPKTGAEDNTSETKKALKDAKLETGNGTPTRKKIYRRKEIINLRLADPQAYEARKEEFSLAYKEGRVR